MMVQTTRLIAAALFALAFAGSVAAADDDKKVGDSFLENCVWDRCKIRDDREMGTFCNNNNTRVFGFDWAQIDLGRCIGNNGGTLMKREAGEFWKSCENCNLTNKHDDGTQYLECKACGTTDGDMRESRVDLADVLYSEDGALGCYDHVGSKHDRPDEDWSRQDDGPAWENDPDFENPKPDDDDEDKKDGDEEDDEEGRRGG